jgi:nucleoside-diphosphate-sugar epimerase
MSTILVTGGSGFIGSHSILQLLAAGHQVRTTVRSLKRDDSSRRQRRRLPIPGTNGREKITVSSSFPLPRQGPWNLIPTERWS